MTAINGAGAIDLASLKTHDQKQQLAEQLLKQAGLLCAGCGQRLHGHPTIYITINEAMLPSPSGPQPGLQLGIHTICNHQCPAAHELETIAIAKRDGPAGHITWLDEQRAALATTNGPTT